MLGVKEANKETEYETKFTIEEQKRETYLSAKSFNQSEAEPPLYYKIHVLLVSTTFTTFPKVASTGRLKP